MNEEEKKAVEFIRDLITWDVRQYLCPNKEECKNLEIILNLIEKQQKEIDLCEETEIALNNRIMDLEEINEKCKLKTELYLNSIPKSKIENKIETYRRVVADSNDGDLIHDLRTAIHILEELLGND